MFINKLLLGGILTCLSIPSFAQIQITPEVGASIYKDGSAKEKATVSPRIGVGVDYFFNQQKDGWGLMSGLYFYQKKVYYTLAGYTYQNDEGENFAYPVVIPPGSIYNEWKPTDDMTLKKVTSSDTYMRRDYLQLPVMVKYKWQINDTYAISAAAGGYVALGISGKHRIDEYSFLVDEKKQDYHRFQFDSPYVLLKYNRFDAGFSSRLSLHANRLSINLNYETNLYRRDMMGHENLISLTAGYTF